MKVFISIVFLSLLLILRFFFFSHNLHAYHAGEHVSFQTTLLTEPGINGKFQTIILTLPDSLSRASLSLPLFPQFSYGDHLQVSGLLQTKTTGKTTIISIKTDKNRVDMLPVNPMLAPLRVFRERVILLFQETLPEPLDSLLLGIVFGIKASMQKSFLVDLQATGLLHVIAASGMNVTMVAGFLFGMFGKITRRQIAIVLSLLGLISYALLAGLGASIVRATILSGITFSAGIFGRQKLSLFALLITGFSMLLYNPGYLFDVGFQLSFGATMGIMLLKPVLDGFLPKKRFILTEDFTTTIAAQVATLPILLGAFGTYGLLSIFVNGLVLWMVPPLMVLGGIGAVIGVVLPLIGKGFVFLCLPLLFLFQTIVQFSGTLPFVLKIETLPWPFVAGYYLLLLAVLLWFETNVSERSEDAMHPSPANCGWPSP